MYRHLTHWLERFTSARVLVVGDLILDRYVWGSAERISAEAPVPVVRVTREETRLGGAGAVVAMARALGARVTCFGVVGEDGAGAEFRRELEALELPADEVLTDPDFPTTVKTRILARAQHVCRVDHDPDREVAPEVRRGLLERLRAQVSQADVLCIEDYNKGLLSAELLRALIEAGRDGGVAVLVDPWRHRDFGRYRGASLICPNRMEAAGAVGRPLETTAEVQAASAQLLEELDAEAVLVTLGSRGSALTERGGGFHLVPAEPRAVFDVTGAGDMTLAALAVSVAAGTPYLEAAQLANVAGGLKVEKLGTAVVSREELLADLSGLSRSHRAKVLPRERLAQVLTEHRRRGETVVFTNGCFDLLHPGHLKLLEFAQNQGDVLVVAVNSDASVRGLKGAGRPVLAEEARTQVVAALGAVDYVTLFAEPTPLETIRMLRPEVLIKGEDWKEKGVVGREFVESYGGRVVLAPLASGYSTTDIIQRLREPGGPAKEGNP